MINILAATTQCFLLVQLLFSYSTNALQTTSNITTSEASGITGILDAPMYQIREDGRNSDQISVFERRRQALEYQRNKEIQQSDHPMLELHGQDIDMTMDMMWDNIHVVNISLTDASDHLQLIPTTELDNLVLLHKDCDRCYSRHGVEWSPDVKNPITKTIASKTIDYAYMFHIFQATISGHYWFVNGCLQADKEAACALDLVVFAVQKARPFFNTLVDGYFGLAPGLGLGGVGDNHNNLFEQLNIHQMLTKRQFGVHTHTWNSTEDPSQIRFGGYNEELFKSGHKQIWLETINNTSWNVALDQFSFSGTNFFKNQKALIDPGYQYIIMPQKIFQEYKAHLKNMFPDDPLTCEDDEWCYFLTSCDVLQEKLTGIDFKFSSQSNGTVTYSVPPQSFLFSDVDYRTNFTNCHLSLLGHKQENKDYWTLGSVFMENFYVTYDAEDPKNLLVGLSYNREDLVESSNENGSTENASMSTEMFIFALIAASGLVFIFITITVCTCMRRKREKRLQQRKIFFDSMKNDQYTDDSDQEINDDNNQAINPYGEENVQLEKTDHIF